MVPKIVIDTNIYISAIFWGGKPRAVVDLGRSEQVLIFTFFLFSLSTLNIPIVFPVHSRTAKMLKRYDCSLSDKIYQLPPLGFQELRDVID